MTSRLIFELSGLFSKLEHFPSAFSLLCCCCWSFILLYWGSCFFCVCIWPLPTASLLSVLYYSLYLAFFPHKIHHPPKVPLKQSQPTKAFKAPTIPCKKYRQQAEAVTGKVRQIFPTPSIWRPRSWYLTPDFLRDRKHFTYHNCLL